MRRNSQPDERAQFSVAELLARYGEPTPTSTSTTGRRRRRSPDDAGSGADISGADIAAQSVIEPNRIDSGPQPVADPLASLGVSRHGYAQAQGSVSGQGSAPVQGSALGHSSAPVHSPAPSYLNGRGSRQWAPAVGPPSAVPAPSAVPGRSVVPGPASVYGRQSLTATVLSDDPATVQFPRLDPMSVKPATRTGRLPGGTELSSGLGNGIRDIPEQQSRDTTEEPHDDEVQQPDHGSPMQEWAMMVAQIGVGVVGGAALWLICEWLWQRIPVVALVVALAVITGLVWVVRRVRRAEDLQTTVIAVLVGLFVTVSPAALLLVGR